MPLLAKPRHTLINHTRDVLKVFKSLSSILKLSHVPDGIDLESTLVVAIVMHDIGKAASGFQDMLQKATKNVRIRWDYRHEILSAAFMSALTFKQETMEQASILAALTHHKDLTKLYSSYNPGRKSSPGYNRFRDRLFETKQNLIEVIDLIHSLSKELSQDYPIASSILSSFPSDPDELIQIALDNEPIGKYAIPYLQGIKRQTPCFSKLVGMLLKGIMTASDHLGSASPGTEIRKLQPNLQFTKYLPNEGQTWTSNLSGSGILVAPTGSGKTEAALLWFKKNMQSNWVRRVFYLLPTIASINKMYLRLRDQLSRGVQSDFDLVSMIHYRSSFFLHDFYSDDNYYDEQRLRKHLIGISRMVYSPMKVSTPFQPLKAIFGVAGYERTLTELMGSLICVDEIHAYDPHTAALILVMLEVLKREYGANVLLMSATFPNFLRQIYQSALDINDVSIKQVILDGSKPPRHRLELVDGDVHENIDRIKSCISDHKTLVVCNTVRTAIEVYKQLASHVKGKSLLLHGRFMLRDRIRIENELENEFESINLLVATQAVEVSLDISFERIFTEPAPIDALLQRFGRVNRKGELGTIPVYVFRQGSESDRYVYRDYDRVVTTLQVFEDFIENQEGVLTDQATHTLIEAVYHDGYSAKEQEEFDFTRDNFLEVWNALQPFSPGSPDAFYQLFDSVEVVPRKHRDEIIDILDEGKKWQISEYIISIRYNMYKRLYTSGLVEQLDDINILDVDYNQEYGLDNPTLRRDDVSFVL